MDAENVRKSIQYKTNPQAPTINRENTIAACNYYYYLKHESDIKNALFTPSILIFSLLVLNSRALKAYKI